MEKQFVFPEGNLVSLTRIQPRTKSKRSPLRKVGNVLKKTPIFKETLCRKWKSPAVSRETLFDLILHLCRGILVERRRGSHVFVMPQMSSGLSRDKKPEGYRGLLCFWSGVWRGTRIKAKRSQLCSANCTAGERERGGKKDGGKKKKRPKAVPSELSEDPRLPVQVFYCHNRQMLPSNNMGFYNLHS